MEARHWSVGSVRDQDSTPFIRTSQLLRRSAYFAKRGSVIQSGCPAALTRLWNVFSLPIATMTYPSAVSSGPNSGLLGAVISNCDHCNSNKVRLSIDSNIETS